MKTVSLIEREEYSVCPGKVVPCIRIVFLSDTQMRVTNIGLGSGQSPEDWDHDCLMSSFEFDVAMLRDFQLLANLVGADFEALSKQIPNWPTSCQTAIFKKKR